MSRPRRGESRKITREQAEALGIGPRAGQYPAKKELPFWRRVEWLTILEAAQVLGVSRTRVQQLAHRYEVMYPYSPRGRKDSYTVRQKLPGIVAGGRLWLRRGAVMARRASLAATRDRE